MRRTIVAVSLAASAFFAAPAAAQAPWTAEGRLQNGDDQDGDHRLYDIHYLLLTAGTRYRMTCRIAHRRRLRHGAAVAPPRLDRAARPK